MFLVVITQRARTYILHYIAYSMYIAFVSLRQLIMCIYSIYIIYIVLSIYIIVAMHHILIHFLNASFTIIDGPVLKTPILPIPLNVVFQLTYMDACTDLNRTIIVINQSFNTMYKLSSSMLTNLL